MFNVDGYFFFFFKTAIFLMTPLKEFVFLMPKIWLIFFLHPLSSLKKESSSVDFVVALFSMQVFCSLSSSWLVSALDWSYTSVSVSWVSPFGWNFKYLLWINKVLNLSALLGESGFCSAEACPSLVQSQWPPARRTQETSVSEAGAWWERLHL